MVEQTETKELIKTETKEFSPPNVDWKKEVALVKGLVAKGCTDTEFKLLYYTANLYKLDPLKKEIWAVKYANKPALIFVGRDGFLAIAHRSGQFGSMEVTYKIDEKSNVPISATCTIYRKDFDKPFINTVFYDEYKDSFNPLWRTKPRVMLGKVAEVACLRRAFNVSGIFAPEEFGHVEKKEKKGVDGNEGTGRETKE